jgi:uncharacterized protein
VGRILARALRAAGHRVIILTRTPRGESDEEIWDGVRLGSWTERLETTDVVINLAGRSVNCRYTPQRRQEILDSRVESTRVVGQAIAAARKPPSLWLQASTATIYAHTFGKAHGEDGVLGGEEPGIPSTWKFSVEVAKAWEGAATEAKVACPMTRLVLMRTSFVLSPDPGGAFDVLISLIGRGLGGTQGSGRQFVSWIHETDFVRAVQWIVERPEFTGPVNLASPYPLPNREFMKDLRQAAGMKLGLPANRWMLECGAIAMQTETELLLKSRRVSPAKLLQSGFLFRFPHLPEAASELVQRWRTG